MIDSPLAEQTRNQVELLLRKGRSDREIYYELARLYGPHICLKATTKDGSIRGDGAGLTLIKLIYGCAAPGAVLAGAYLLKRRKG